MSTNRNEYKDKYNKDNYKRIAVHIKPDDYYIIDDYCKDNNISKARFVVAACKAYIMQHINFDED